MTAKISKYKKYWCTLWQTHQITEDSKTPILRDTTHNTILYLDKEKSKDLTWNFEQVHTNAYNTYSAIEQEIEHKATLSL